MTLIPHSYLGCVAAIDALYNGTNQQMGIVKIIDKNGII